MQLGAAEYALLGMIVELGDDTDGMHGYSLAQRFTDGALARVIHLEPGMLYHYLKKLARGGLIRTRIEPQERRPDRQIHLATEAGRASLAAWIAAPVRATREIRLEFLVKLFLVRRDERAVDSLVARQHEVMDGLVDSLREQLNALDDNVDDDDVAFERAVLHLRLGQTEATLAWLETFSG